MGTFSACSKDPNCDNSPAGAPGPVIQTKFRITDSIGRDLLSIATPGNYNFDSLVVKQPCNELVELGKKVNQTGAGGLESYEFTFTGDRQPVTGENEECFDMYLMWDAQNVDTLNYVVTSESTECGVIYTLNSVIFNGEKALLNENGAYVLRKR